MAAMGWWEKSRIHQALKRIVAGPGLVVDPANPSVPVVSAKISTDASNALSFGTDDGLYATSESPFANQLVIRKDFHGVTAGDELYAYMSSPMTIGGVSILATPPGDLVVDVRRTPIGSFPATGGDSICAAAKPTLAAAQTYLDTTLTGWSTSSIEGDTLTIHVDSVTTVTDFEITLYGQAEVPPLVITGHLPDATIGDMASYSYTVTGGYGTTTVTLYSGALPAGSSISTAGAVSGTYTTGGSYSWVLQVEDSLGSKAYLSDSNAIAYATLNVTGAFTDTDLGDPLNGSPLAITGGAAPYSLSGSPYSGTRPAGVTISVSGTDLVATGSTTTASSYSWTERVTSADGQHYDVVCSIDVTVPSISAKHWRIYVTVAYQPSNNYSSVAEMELALTPGGADQCSGGTATADSQYSGTYSASKAFDNNTTTQWVSTVGYPHWLAYELPSAMAITELRITSPDASYGTAGENPRDFLIQYSSNGVSWTTARTITNVTGWGVGVTKTWSIP